MDENEFIDAVARRSGTSFERASALTRATLTTLAERIDGGQARDLSTQLPERLREYAFAPSETAERFGTEEFVQRVSGRAEVESAEARRAVPAVFDTLREAVPPGEFDDVGSHLPVEFWELAGIVARPEGQPGS